MNYKKFLLAPAMLLTVAACTTQPVMNVTDQPVVSIAGKPLTPDQVRSAIVKAGTGLGWVLTPISPGLVSGRLSLRDHVAIVDIRYTEKTFSITYQDSTNLN